MSLLNLTRLTAVLASAALTAGAVSAAPPGGGPRPGGGARPVAPPIARPAPAGVYNAPRPAPAGVYNAPRPYAAPYNPGYRGGVSIGIGIGGGYGSGLYSPLGYGLGYSPFGYSGLPYGGTGYGALGYGYGYPGTSLRTSSLGAPIVPGTYSAQYPPGYQTEQLLPMRDANAEPIPLPLPNGAGGSVESADGTPAKITVITNEGAKVTFDGIESDQTGTRHSFTTKSLGTSAEARVKVTVDGSTITIGVRGGEKATVDMRK